jgi:GMP synthase-like glutamine amidotransferase
VRAHYFQHVPFEGLGSVEDWLRRRGAAISATRFFVRPVLPALDSLDWLIVLGGPMSVNDEDALPWLREEKRFLREAIRADKVVLGICLGAQLIADAMGGRVYRNREREIGWFAVRRVAPPEAGAMAGAIPESILAFHWHGETFDLPPGAVRLARSDGCENQAFALGRRALGVQFHLETTPAAARALIEHARNEMTPGPFVQPEADLLAAPRRFADINRAMERVLDHLERA